VKVVDLFAGWGGFTDGAEQAGATVVYAANHWPLAVEAHAANHPTVQHECQDLRQADWGALPEHDVLLASPACQGHSTAANGARKANPGVHARHDALRATAWAVVDCVEVCRPQALVVENVPDFKRWGLYDLWSQALGKLGYTLDTRVLRASHLQTPQRRDRLFIFGMLKGAVRKLDAQPEPAFGPCIDWDANAKWRQVDPVRRPRVAERVTRSRARHGHRFLTQHTRDHMGVPLNEPIRTITTKDQWAIVDGDRYRPLTVRETARAMGFRDSYAWPASATRKDAIKGLGNAVCPPVAKAAVSAVMEAL
jgi:DNA (cytosine-5)-methyltransferase 1